jgi:hypothetical protein
MARLQNSVLVEDVEYPQLSIGGKHLPSAGSYKPMTRSNYEFLADMVAPLMGWPSAIEAMANELQKNNPAFKRDKFIKRAVKAWEDVNPMEELDDYNPY